jgi:hypothetical protein
MIVSLFIAIVWGWIAPQPLRAEEVPLQMLIQPAFDGQTKNGAWTSVTFTITNSGSDVSGDLAVQVNLGYGGKDVTYHTHVDLPKGTTKSVTMDLPGFGYSKRNNMVAFYKDSIVRGHAMPIEGGTPSIDTVLLQDGTVRVGILARDPDTLNFLALLAQKGYQVQTLPLKAEQLPAGGMALDQLDALVVNDFASDALKPEQTKTVDDWVKRGGLLVLAGGAGYMKSAGPFEAMSPVQYKGTSQLSSLGQLAQLGGKPIELGQNSFTVSTADLRDGRSVVVENGIPLLATRSYGAGQVWYAAYDLALAPVAAWPGNPTLWETVLADKLTKAGSGVKYRSPMMGSNPDWEMSNALDYFPALKAPSFGILVLVILVYSLIIGPLLYFVLKRMDRRGWAWFLVPAAAVLCTIGVYTVGASGRSSTIAQSMQIVQLDGQGSGTKAEAISVFVPRGGTYQLELGAGVYPITFNMEGGFSPNGQLNGAAETFFASSNGQWTARFTHVPYWSIRKVWTQTPAMEQLGSLEAKLQFNGGIVSGQITNKTKESLSDVAFIAFQQVILLGELQPGETKPINGAVNTQTMGFGLDLGNMIFPYRGGTDDHMQERAMLNHLTNGQALGVSGSEPLLIGFSTKKLSGGLKVGGSQVTVGQKSLYAQKVKLDYTAGGMLQLPSVSMVPSVQPANGVKVDVNPTGITFFAQGEAVIEYRLPDVSGATLSKLNGFTQGVDPNVLKYEIWNDRKQQWEEVVSSNAMQDGGLPDYLIGGRTLRFKASAKQNASLAYPIFSVEGAVKP